MGEGRGDGSGKWMGATLNSVVAAGPVLDNCGFLRPPWDGEGRGEWEVDGRNFIFCCSAVGPVLDNCGFLRPPWDGGGRGDGSGKWMAATLCSVLPVAPTV